MKNNMFMALATGMLNALALVLTPLIGSPEAKQAAMAFISLASPFLSIWLLKIYIRADDPPELTRNIAGLKESIKICKSHLKEKDCTEAFKNKTRSQLEELQSALQKIRSAPVGGSEISITPIQGSSVD